MQDEEKTYKTLTEQFIRVTYEPADGGDIFSTGERTHVFYEFNEFASWVKGYVCDHCLQDFRENFGHGDPITLTDWLSGGCGCEIGIEDPQSMINWDLDMRDVK